MGDRPTTSSQSAAAPLAAGEHSPSTPPSSSNASAPVAVRPIVSVTPAAPVSHFSSKPPATDEIDSEWGEEEAAPPKSAEQAAAVRSSPVAASEPRASKSSLPPLPAPVGARGSSQPPPAVRNPSPSLPSIPPPSSPLASSPRASSVPPPPPRSAPAVAARSSGAPSGRTVPQEYDTTQKSLVSPEFPADPAVPSGLRSESITIREPAIKSPLPPQTTSSIPASDSSRYSSDPAPTIKSEMAPPLGANETQTTPRRRRSSSATMADSPQGFASVRARERAAASSPSIAPAAPSSSSQSKLFLGIVLAVAAGVAFVLTRGTGASKTEATIQAVVPAQSAVIAQAPAAPTAELGPVANQMPPVAEALPAAAAPPTPEPASPAKPDTAPKAMAALPASPSAAPAHAADDSVSAPITSSGKLAVMINVRQPQARVFYKGKEIGKPPITVELEPGSRRSFEVVAPGFQTRKLVVDGSKAHIMIGLRAAPGTATAP